ncbi:hypothetical protein BK004_02680 [bacterium CG10_46_32]|nr:MAG: hypothetical protein BK004_02680 [bacterium CG10_46_32]PIR56107.1 MAG: hypothetical protein COU73_02705 [Parcubacteria group bacterium CG10_big_fil_rev_8_21_14_0_10_46_32]
MNIPFFHKNQTSAPVSVSSLDALHKVRLGVIIMISIIMALMLVFLYRDFYQTIIQARVVIVLKQEVALENIDISLFNKVRTAHEYKITRAIKNPIADPFDTAPIIIAPAVDETPQNIEQQPTE